MTHRTLWMAAVLALPGLSGCSAPPATPQVRALHQEVGQLNQQMRQLTRQASALEIQGQLNSQSAQGAWLLPQANTPVALQTQAGTLTFALSPVEGDASGSRALLSVTPAASHPLPAFSATVEWGEMDPASGKPLNAEHFSQTIHVAASLIPQQTVTVPLRLNGLPPARLGYVRVHEVLSAPAASAAAAP
ncbi:DUF3251 domain-containing protein [Candidatus Pantoea soli]|uniref:DUF3251 domain-containing protein n=1 Tax=Candidatus Pantoea soli TaxID=3098669 RepID=A0A518XAG3_9GAMM|nr:DUF3251 domain-containing protein [Pantoea soli]QDY41188.1 DUF3251 domain-containing protein [Pantoea soli]